MPLLILVLSMYVASIIHRCLQAYGPSNLVVAQVRRTRPRLRVAGGLCCLAAAFMFFAAIVSEYAVSGGPGWLHLVVLVAIWDGLKFAVLAMAVLLRWARAKEVTLRLDRLPRSDSAESK